MRNVRALIVCIFVAATSGAAWAQSPSALNVYDVIVYGASGTANCALDTEKIQDAIDAAHDDGGGIVFFPAGSYCVTDELKVYENITLKGASAGTVDASSASVLYAPSDFGQFGPASVIRTALRDAPSNRTDGVKIEDLSIYTPSTHPGIVGVDFTGVWYGSIRNVGVSGELSGSPRQVHSSGSIGFLLSDREGGANACFANVIERTSVHAMDTAYLFLTHNNQTLNTLTNFWVSDCTNGLWISNQAPTGGFAGGLGLSIRDGYMTTYLNVTGKKAVKYTASGGTPTVQMMNVQWEMGSTGQPFGFDGGSDLKNHPSGGLTVLGGLPILLDGEISARRLSQGLMWADGYYCGANAACPCRPRRYPPPQSLSFWAKIPSGTTIQAGGADDFVFQTTYGYHPGQPPIADLYFTFHPTKTANIGQLFQMTATNDVMTLPEVPTGAAFQTYHVKIYVQTQVTLTSDFVFFLEANTTYPQQPPGSTCGG